MTNNSGKVFAVFPDRSLEDFAKEEPEAFSSFAMSLVDLLLSFIEKGDDVEG